MVKSVGLLTHFGKSFFRHGVLNKNVLFKILIHRHKYHVILFDSMGAKMYDALASPICALVGDPVFLVGD